MATVSIILFFLKLTPKVPKILFTASARDKFTLIFHLLLLLVGLK